MKHLGRVSVALCLVLLAGGRAHADEEWMFDPVFREGQGGDVLHEGPPPLLRAQLDALVDLVEAAFELALAPDAEQGLRDAFEIWYGAVDADARAGFATLVAPRASLALAARRGDAATLEAGLQAFRRALDERLAAAPAAKPHQRLRALLVQRQAIPWPGTPPVHAPAADAWLEAVELLVSLARNEDFEPTPGQVAFLKEDLAASMHGETTATRERLRDLHRTWLRLKAAWDGADVGRRLALRWKAVDLLARALPPERKVAIGEPGDLQAYARASKTLARTLSGYEAWSSLARQPVPLLALMDAWLGPPPAGGDHVLLYR